MPTAVSHCRLQAGSYRWGGATIGWERGLRCGVGRPSVAPMQSQSWLFAAAGYDVALAVFHLAFWRMFRWHDELPKLHPVNRGVLQALNIMLTAVLLFMAALLLLRPADLTGTPLGRLVLAGMTAFWVLRAVLQPFLWRGLPAATNAAFAILFSAGAGLHALAFPAA
jgi:hypothetical protein